MADQPSAVSGALRQPFREQIAFFRGKLGDLVPTQRWDDLTGDAHDTAFMVAGAQKAELLQDLAVSIDRAIAQGTSLDAFRKDFSAAVDRHDWHGWTGEDTKGGRAWRTRTIYRTNASTSYAAGRRAQLEAGKFKYWIYRHGGSKEPRLEHLDFDGIALPPDHPFWAKFFPPSDWGCSCYVVGARTGAGIRRLGGDPEKALPDGWDRVDPRTGEPNGIGKGWGYAPGARVAQAINDKLRNWEGPIATAFLEGLPTRVRLMIVGEGGMPSPVTSVAQLTDEERAAIVIYTGGSYRRINDALREESPEEPETAPITSALGRSALPADVVVYRGFRDEFARELIATGLQPGMEFSEPGFISTSRSRQIADNFRSSDPTHGILLIVNLRRDARALDIQSISQYPNELEILLQRGHVLRVVSWDGKSRVLEVELAPDRSGTAR